MYIIVERIFTTQNQDLNHNVMRLYRFWSAFFNRLSLIIIFIYKALFPSSRSLKDIVLYKYYSLRGVIMFLHYLLDNNIKAVTKLSMESTLRPSLSMQPVSAPRRATPPHITQGHNPDYYNLDLCCHKVWRWNWEQRVLQLKSLKTPFGENQDLNVFYKWCF